MLLIQKVIKINYQSIQTIFASFALWYEKIATNTTNSIRTHNTGVRFSSYQFVAFFMFTYEPEFIVDFAVNKKRALQRAQKVQSVQHLCIINNVLDYGGE